MLNRMLYAFDDMQLDLTKMELRKGGLVSRVEPQVFALVGFLVQHRDRVVSKDEILEKIWEGRVVTDSALSSRIKSARRALGDNGKAQRLIKTLHGRGFRFVGSVRVQRDTDSVLGVDIDGSVNPTGVAPSIPARPSIAVLPFQRIGNPGPFATIADGLPHELIAELSRLRWLFVIARASSFRLRDEQPDLQSVGQVLGVRYCLTGSVGVSGKELIVTTELIDTRGGDVFWAERYTGSVNDVHSIRVEIRSSVLSSLEIQIPLHEAAGVRLTDANNLDAWSAYHLGLQHLYRFNREDNSLAEKLFLQAITSDPEFARAHAGLSFVHFQTAFMSQSDDIARDITLARGYAQRGVDIDPLDPFVNFTMGRSFWLDANLDQALAWLERSTSLSPSYAQGIYARAWTEAIAGNASDALKHADLAMRLSPLDPLHYAMLGTRALAHVSQGE